MSKITKYLNQLITGNVYDSPEILDYYSTDRSILKVTPKFVALPESTDDLRRLMKFFYQLSEKGLRVPIAIRGSGLDEMGADLSPGVVISTEKLNHLMEIDSRERLVRVQAGITLKELNTALSVNGLTLPVKANENETIGGLIANCPTDSYAAKYGGIMHFVERAEIVLTNGECIQTNRINKFSANKKAGEKTLEGSIYKELIKLTSEKAEFLKEYRVKNTSSAGYPTIAHIRHHDSIDLLPLFFASEGTLGIVSEVILRAIPIKKSTTRMIATFPKLSFATDFLKTLAKLNPRELDVVDIRIVKSVEESGKKLSAITKKLEGGYMVFASFDEKTKAAIKKIISASKALPRSTKVLLESEETASIFNEYENSILKYLNLPKTGERTPLLTNFFLPSQNLVDFAKDVALLEKNLRLELALFGSFTASNYSLRPALNIETPNFEKKVIDLLKAGDYIIKRHGGTLVSGTPEGRIKAMISNLEMSKEEREIFTKVKQIFDKNGLLGPDIKLGASTSFFSRHLRTTCPAKVVV